MVEDAKQQTTGLEPAQCILEIPSQSVWKGSIVVDCKVVSYAITQKCVYKQERIFKYAGEAAERH